MKGFPQTSQKTHFFIRVYKIHMVCFLCPSPIQFWSTLPFIHYYLAILFFLQFLKNAMYAFPPLGFYSCSFLCLEWTFSWSLNGWLLTLLVLFFLCLSSEKLFWTLFLSRFPSWPLLKHFTWFACFYSPIIIWKNQ